MLASRRAGLDATIPDLPPTDHDQGLDVLEVMRNVHVFCARYGYSLSGQCFLERLPASGKFERKHAHCVSPRHVSLSIRQHGTGIVATAINGCYRYLTKKMSVLSAFLYDDHVRSRLARELKHAEEVVFPSIVARDEPIELRQLHVGANVIRTSSVPSVRARFWTSRVSSCGAVAC